ncbi:MAG: response regulator [Nitrospirae bacterium]|nr:response regulator [Candidatus Manganitrophaceae bacterium]
MEKILVVDDDPYTLKLFEKLFRERIRQQSIDITLVSSGNAAKRLFLAQIYNLILMDQHLSDTNGLELLLWMRGERPRQVAILMTGFAETKEVIEALYKGLFTTLSKPFKNLETLEAVMEKGLELDRAYCEIKRLRCAIEMRNDTETKEEEQISSYQEEMAICESCYFERLLKITDGNIVAAARLSGISPQDLMLRLKHCGLS